MPRLAPAHHSRRRTIRRGVNVAIQYLTGEDLDACDLPNFTFDFGITFFLGVTNELACVVEDGGEPPGAFTRTFHRPADTEAVLWILRFEDVGNALSVGVWDIVDIGGREELEVEIG